MAKKPKNDQAVGSGTPAPEAPKPAQSAAAKDKPASGTSRVMEKGKVVIPGPILPKSPEAPKPALKVEKKPEPKNNAPFTVVTSQHIVKTLTKDTTETKLIRLKALAYKNRDVAWLLSEFEKLKTEPKKSE